MEYSTMQPDGRRKNVTKAVGTDGVSNARLLGLRDWRAVG